MNLLSFLTYCFLVNISPGPANAVIVSAVNKEGLRAGIRYATGVSVSFSLLMILSALFNGQLNQALPNVLPIMRLLGASYMLYMAYMIIVDHKSTETSGFSYSFRSGALMTFINPKILAYSLTVLPAFVLPYHPRGIMLWVYVIIITAMGTATLFLWVMFGEIMQQGFSKHSRFISMLLGCFMVYSALLVSGVLH